MAGTTYFLKIDGIPGESTDTKHKDWIEVASFSWGISQEGPGEPAGARRPELRDLTVAKSPDRASPLLFLACAEGKHLPQASLLVLGGPGQEEQVSYKMTDLLVSSFQQGGPNLAGPAETVALHFAALEESVPSVGATGPEPTKGDVDGDGRVSIGDVLAALLMALRGTAPPNPNAFWAADIDGDGSVRLGDVIAILRMAILGTPLATPSRRV